MTHQQAKTEPFRSVFLFMLQITVVVNQVVYTLPGWSRVT